MDGTSEIESHGRDSKVDNDTVAVPLIITDQYFQEIEIKCLTTIKSLSDERNLTAAEDFQTVLNVCQNLRSNLENSTEHANRIQNEYDALLGQYKDSIELSQQNKATIDTQRMEIEKAWRERDAALLREQVAQSQMHTMRDKLDKIEKDSRKTDTSSRDEPGMSLTKQKESLLRERDRLTFEIEDLTKRLQQQKQQNENVEKRRAEFEEKCRELYKLLDETSSEAFKEKRFLDQLRVVLSEVTIERNILSDQLKHYQSQCETLQTNNVQLNLKVGAVKANIIRMTSQYNVCNGKLTKVQTDYNETTTKCDQLQIELGQQINLIKQKESEISRVLKENVQLGKCRDVAQKRAQSIDGENAELTRQLSKLSNSIVTLEKEHELCRKSLEKMKKTTDEVVRERDAIQKDLKRAEGVLDDQRDVIKLQEQHRQSLENEIKIHLTTIQRQTKALNTAKRERDKNATDSQVNAGKCDATQSELELKTKTIADLTEQLNEIRIKLTHVQQQFDSLSAERNSLQKSLNEIIEDRNVVREKLRISVAKQKKLKQTIEDKDTEIFRVGKQIDKMEKEKNVFKTDIKNVTVAIQHIRTELVEKEHECTALYKSFADEEKNNAKITKQLDALQKEKDLIGFDLVKRHDELRLLNEKLEIMQTALDRAEMQYNNRLDDIRILKIEIANLRSHKQLLTRGLCNTIDMRQEVLQLNRDLTQERVKSKALEEEMTTPMNVHRWRKLTGKDPEKMDLIVKVQTLQKRILFQTSVAVQKENDLRQSNMMYNTLKMAMLQFADAPIIKQRLNNTQRALTAKTKKLKALSAESTAKDQEVMEKHNDLEALKKDLFAKKQTLLKEKRDKHKLKIQLDSIKSQLSGVDRPMSGPALGQSYFRTAGSGFRIPSIYAFD